MRWLPVFMLIWGSSVAMAAPDCSFENARYAHADGWTLQFQPVPRDAPANQTASFILGLKSGAKLTGAIMWPNGYSTPLWSVEGPCQPDGDEICRFTEAENNTAYVLADRQHGRFCCRNWQRRSGIHPIGPSSSTGSRVTSSILPAAQTDPGPAAVRSQSEVTKETA
jgi:hypothetical protein